MYKFTCNGTHVWPSRAPGHLVGGWGRREVWTCNNCLATKVIIETDQQVVEPAPRRAV